MFAKIHRFHGYGSLRGVYSRGKNVRGPALGLRVSRRESTKPYRVAVVVSRKVSKSAVVRNRIRRRIYAVIRQMSDDIKPGTDLVFTAFNEQIADMEQTKLNSLLRDLLQKAD